MFHSYGLLSCSVFWSFLLFCYKLKSFAILKTCVGIYLNFFIVSPGTWQHLIVSLLIGNKFMIKLRRTMNFQSLVKDNNFVFSKIMLIIYLITVSKYCFLMLLLNVKRKLQLRVLLSMEIVGKLLLAVIIINITLFNENVCNKNLIFVTDMYNNLTYCSLYQSIRVHTNWILWSLLTVTY